MQINPPSHQFVGSLTDPVYSTSSAQTGSFISTVHTVRKMKVYPILEPELTTLQMFTRDLTWYSAISTFCVGFGIQVAWERLTTDDASNAFRLGIAIACAVIAAITGYVAKQASIGRATELERIKQNAVEIQAQVPVVR